ncbi:MAG: hypothetical protein JST12_13360 [Armatimonadetes bacterium]|nr:hypothetical protein [Armatimonadota bacterium]
MRAARIHSIQITGDGLYPYLTLSQLEGGDFCLAFRSISIEVLTDLEVILTSDDIYGMLEGRVPQILNAPFPIAFQIQGEQVKIVATPNTEHADIEVRVWFSELALAWNLFRQP